MKSQVFCDGFRLEQTRKIHASVIIMEEENIKSFRESVKQFAIAFKNEFNIDEQMKEQLKDPVILGTLIYKLLEERENTNRVLKNLLQKIESLEQKLGARQDLLESEEKKPELDLEMLPEQDRKIIELIKTRVKVCAVEVKEAMGYKGENAASSRLNRLFNLGLLKKAQVGKKVYYMLAK